MNGVSEIKLGSCTVVLLENGIIENIIHPGEHVDVDTVHQLKKANLELANGGKYTLLVTSGHLSSISKEAMTEIAAKGFNNRLLGKAL